LVVAYRTDRAVRISDIGQALDSVEDIRNAGYANASLLLVMVPATRREIIGPWI